MTIAVDFDGVLCEKRWPEIGPANTKLIDHLIELKKKGHTLILWTCRTNAPFKDYNTEKDRYLLKEAVDFCSERGLIFDFINEQDTRSINFFGGDSRKIHADIYIDDSNATEDFMKRYNVPFSSKLAYLESII